MRLEWVNSRKKLKKYCIHAYDFACEIFKNAGYQTRVIPVSTAEYGISKVQRPFNSRLDKNKLIENGFESLPDWQDALKRYMQNEI